MMMIRNERDIRVGRLYRIELIRQRNDKEIEFLFSFTYFFLITPGCSPSNQCIITGQ